MTHRNREDDTVGTVATVAIGAAVAFGAYKLFGSMFSSNNPQQEESRSIERKPQTIPFSPLTPYRFPTDSKIYVVTTPAECKYAMRELKLYVSFFHYIYLLLFYRIYNYIYIVCV